LRGELLAIQAVAKYGLGVWPETASAGLDALRILPRGSYWWCRAAERLIHALPQCGDIANYLQLAQEVCKVEPTPEATPALIGALANLYYIANVATNSDLAGPIWEAIERLQRGGVAEEPRSKGLALMWQGGVMLSMDRTLDRTRKVLDRAFNVFVEGQVHHELCMAGMLCGHVRRALGDIEVGVKFTRDALALAEKIEDGYQTANSCLHLAELLIERHDAAAFDEAEKLAKRVLDASVGRLYEASAWRVLAEVASFRKNPTLALEHAKRAVDIAGELGGLYIYQYAACLIRALLANGCAEEAKALATMRLESFMTWKGRGFFEVPFLLATAEALFAAGDAAGGEKVLRQAVQEVELRALDIMDEPTRRKYYVKKENARVLGLAREKLGETR
jgi:eukaryotic-like serine/threonine-protein kinase